MGSLPKNKKPRQNAISNGSPENDKGHHRIEAKAYAFLSLWIVADLLVIFRHVSIATWIFYFVLVAGLGLSTHHAIKGWPPRKKTFSWIYAGSCVLLPLLLFLFARQPAEPKPHFIISLQIGDSPASKVFLTNDFLFARRVVKGGDLPVAHPC